MGTAAVERLFDISTLGFFLLSGLIASDAGLPYVGIAVTLTSRILDCLAYRVAVRVPAGSPLASRRARLAVPFRALVELLAKYINAFASGFDSLNGDRSFPAGIDADHCYLVLEFGMYWLLAEAFSLDKGFLAIAFAGAAANFGLFIPSAQAGVGPFQWAAKEALINFGVPSSQAAAYALALHVILVVPVSLAGLAVFSVMVHTRRIPPRLAAEEMNIEKPT